MLIDTALAAAGGGTVLDLQADADRPGTAHAVVLKDGRILHVTLDGGLGTAVIAAPQTTTAPPSRRSVLAHH